MYIATIYLCSGLDRVYALYVVCVDSCGACRILHKTSLLHLHTSDCTGTCNMTYLCFLYV